MPGFFDKKSSRQSDRGPWFIASFGKCAECGIELEDEHARFVDGEVLCRECGDDDKLAGTVKEETPTMPICGKCFIELSVADTFAGRTTHEEC